MDRMDEQQNDRVFDPLFRALTRLGFDGAGRDELLASYMFMYEGDGLHAYKHRATRVYVYLTEAGEIDGGVLDTGDHSSPSVVQTAGLLDELSDMVRIRGFSALFPRLHDVPVPQLLGILEDLRGAGSDIEPRTGFYIEYITLSQLERHGMLPGKVDEAGLRQKWNVDHKGNAR